MQFGQVRVLGRGRGPEMQARCYRGAVGTGRHRRGKARPMNCCPTCGREYPPRISVRGIIRQRIVNALAEAADGLHRDQLMNVAYYDCPNGGPEFVTLRVNIWQTNKVLAPMGYRIEADMGRGSRYRLVPIQTLHAATWSKPFAHPELL